LRSKKERRVRERGGRHEQDGTNNRNQHGKPMVEDFRRTGVHRLDDFHEQNQQGQKNEHITG
jgi:hypothetical protein